MIGTQPALVLELAGTASGVFGIAKSRAASTIAAEASMPVTNAPRHKIELDLKDVPGSAQQEPNQAPKVSWL